MTQNQSQNPLRISPDLLTYSDPTGRILTPEQARRLYAPPRTLGASEDYQLAMDHNLAEGGFHSLLTHALASGLGLEQMAPQFPGYAALAGLAQNGLIRAGVTSVADEMTRAWINLRHDSDGDGLPDNLDPEGRLAALFRAFEDFGVQELFNEAAQKCDFDGGCLIYLDTGETDDAILRQPLRLDPAGLARGSLKRLTLIEAVNLYPGPYNSTNPLAPDHFRPETWMVLGRVIHKSRFLYFAPNQVPMLLRPAYNFFGIPAAQLALDYVAHFTQTREAAQRLLTKFSLTVFKSDMSQILCGGGAENFDRRMLYLARKRDNDAILAIDLEREDIVKLETPLAGVTDIVRQYLEFVAAVFRLPVVKLLGISPAGMNATGEFDERNFLDHVAQKQQKILRRPLDRLLKVMQLHLFGQIDPSLRADFCPLTAEEDNQRSQTRKAEAERDSAYVKAAVLSPREVRRRLKEDQGSGYNFIDPDEEPGDFPPASGDK